MKDKEHCRTDPYNLALLSKNNKNKSYTLIFDDLDEFTSKELEKGNLPNDKEIYTIPIVFHVVYNKHIENIEAKQILSQIDSLNKDFRNKNTDKIPLEFDRERNLATDSKIEFIFASKDPNGNPTEGITRTHTKIESFTPITDSGSTPIEQQPVKCSSQGGKDAWPSKKYLNVWICNLEGGKGGYAQYPYRNPDESQKLTDGIVIDYRSVGSNGTAEEPFHLGRTLTHETGHWLGLHHLWGPDDNAGCHGDDRISDTPPQSGPQKGCPKHYQKENKCDEAYPLLMNFMDYLDDECSLMFTNGQTIRMREQLKTMRASVII